MRDKGELLVLEGEHMLSQLDVNRNGALCREVLGQLSKRRVLVDTRVD